MVKIWLTQLLPSFPTLPTKSSPWRLLPTSLSPTRHPPCLRITTQHTSNKERLCTWRLALGFTRWARRRLTVHVLSGTMTSRALTVAGHGRGATSLPLRGSWSSCRTTTMAQRHQNVLLQTSFAGLALNLSLWQTQTGLDFSLIGGWSDPGLRKRGSLGL